jgi:hypothetical protein
VIRAILVWLVVSLMTTQSFAYECNGRHYINSSGHLIHSPSCYGQHIHHISAHCRDGSISSSEHHRGTCSHHHGVAYWG